jgi:hypothetical protein
MMIYLCKYTKFTPLLVSGESKLASAKSTVVATKEKKVSVRITMLDLRKRIHCGTQELPQTKMQGVADDEWDA